MKYIYCIYTILFSLSSYSDDLGIRYNNVSTGSVLGFNGGKIVEVKYDHTLGFCNNLYLEGATGPYFASDFDQFNSYVIEASPGVQVRAGALRARLSQGISYIPYLGIPSLEFGTHVSLSLIDDTTETYIGLEETHYSSGSSTDVTNTGLNMTGLIVGFKL